MNIRIFRNVLCCLYIALYSISSGYAQPLDSLLHMPFQDLMNVEIRAASKSLQKVHEVSAKVKIITANEIEQRGYQTIDEALSDIPGFQFRNIQSINSYIFSRGIPNQNNLMLLLIDGIQINELNSGGFYAGGLYNLDNVEQIEIIYGPASTVYGSNALTGVVNIVTKQADKYQGIDINIHKGSFNSEKTQAAFGYQNPKKDVSLRVSGMIKKTDKGEFGGAAGNYNWSETVENYEDDYSADIRLTIKQITLGTNFLNKQASTNLYHKTVGTPYNEFGTFWNIGFLNTYVSYSVAKFNKISLNHTTFYRNSTVYRNTIAYVLDTAQVGYYRPNSVIGSEITYNYIPFSKLQIIGGICFEQEHLAEDYSKTYSSSAYERPEIPLKPKILTEQLYTTFVQAKYLLLPSVNIIGGSRIDYSSMYHVQYIPNAAIIFYSPKLNAKLLYSEAFRAPKPWDFTWGMGNSNLEPEQIKTLEANLNYQIIPSLVVEKSFSKNIMHNMLIKNDENTKWINSDSLVSNVHELEIQYIRKKVQTYVNYTYIWTHTDTLPAEIAKHSANCGVHFQPSKSLGINLRANYIGARQNANTVAPYIDAATVFHGKIMYHTPYDISISLDVKNIFDTEYYHTSNRSADKYRQAQRTILLGLQWNIPTHTLK